MHFRAIGMESGALPSCYSQAVGGGAGGGCWATQAAGRQPSAKWRHTLLAPTALLQVCANCCPSVRLVPCAPEFSWCAPLATGSRDVPRDSTPAGTVLFLSPVWPERSSSAAGVCCTSEAAAHMPVDRKQRCCGTVQQCCCGGAGGACCRMFTWCSRPGQMLGLTLLPAACRSSSVTAVCC